MKPIQQKSRIVSDGADRLRRAARYAAERRRLLADLMQTFESEIRSQSWWRRIWLRIEMRRAVRAELNKKFPPGALHLAAGRGV